MYQFIQHAPEFPINERWAWETDAIVATDGTEQRISLSSVPNRSWQGTMQFDTETSLRRFLATSFAKYRGQFEWPLFHLQVNLKQAVTATATQVFVNTARSDFRAGAKAILLEGETAELVEVSSVSADRIVLSEGLAGAFSKRAVAIPVVNCYTNPSTNYRRGAVNSYANAQFQYMESDFPIPFIANEDKVTLQLYKSIPVLNLRPMGIEFDSALFTNLETTVYGGIPSFRDTWLSPVESTKVDFLWQRLFDPEGILFWKTFGDYCRGATKPFYFPSVRPDLQVRTSAVGGGTTVTLQGTEYSQHYYSLDSKREIVLTKPDGTQHFARVSAVNSASGHDVLTFTPALPAGSWANHIVGFMSLCRLDDGIIELQHYETHSIVKIGVRTAT